MKKSINVLVVEDSEYYNKILSSALKESLLALAKKWNFKYSIKSFSRAGEFISKMKSNSFEENFSIAFLDYYLGDGINATHLIKILKEQAADTTIVVLSNSNSVREKIASNYYDYFVSKDNSSLPLCCLCLEQYIDNKFFIPLK